MDQRTGDRSDFYQPSTYTDTLLTKHTPEFLFVTFKYVLHILYADLVIASNTSSRSP